MDEGKRLHSIFEYLKEHTRRLNPGGAGRRCNGDIEPRTSIIETSKGQLAIQCYCCKAGAIRPRFVKLNEKGTSRISGKQLSDLLDRIADPTCADPYPLKTNVKRARRRSQSTIPGANASDDDLDDNDLDIDDDSFADPDFRPERRRPMLHPKKRRRPALKNASTNIAHTSSSRDGRVQNKSTNSPSGGLSTAVGVVDHGDIQTDDDSSYEPELGLVPVAPDRNPAVDLDSINKQESLVQMLRVRLEEEERVMGRQKEHIKSVASNLASLDNENNPTDYAGEKQIIRAIDQLQALRHTLAQQLEHAIQCKTQFEEASALLGKMHILRACRDNLHKVQFRYNEVDQEMSQAYLNRHTAAPQRMEAFRNELDRSTEMERTARDDVVRMHVGPSP
jgi:hypothetical protein